MRISQGHCDIRSSISFLITPTTSSCLLYKVKPFYHLLEGVLIIYLMRVKNHSSMSQESLPDQNLNREELVPNLNL